MKYLILTLSLCLMACAKQGGSSDQPPADNSKDLFSLWSSTSTSFRLDLRGKTFGSSTMSVLFTNSAVCTATFTISGTQGAGSYSITGAAYLGGGPGDPGCSSLNGPGVYTKVSSTLNMCDNTCMVFQ